MSDDEPRVLRDPFPESRARSEGGPALMVIARARESVDNFADAIGSAEMIATRCLKSGLPTRNQDAILEAFPDKLRVSRAELAELEDGILARLQSRPRGAGHSPDDMLQFDANVDLSEHNVPPGMSPSIAVERVRAALESLTGARWVSVEWRGGLSAAADWVRVYQQDAIAEMTGPSGKAITALLKVTARKALFTGLAAV